MSSGNKYTKEQRKLWTWWNLLMNEEKLQAPKQKLPFPFAQGGDKIVCMQ